MAAGAVIQKLGRVSILPMRLIIPITEISCIRLVSFASMFCAFFSTSELNQSWYDCKMNAGDEMIMGKQNSTTNQKIKYPMNFILCLENQKKAIPAIP